VSINFFKDQIKNWPKTTLLISYQQYKKEEEEFVAGQEKKIERIGKIARKITN
jgi:hypothetical protein